MRAGGQPPTGELYKRYGLLCAIARRALDATTSVQPRLTSLASCRVEFRKASTKETGGLAVSSNNAAKSAAAEEEPKDKEVSPLARPWGGAPGRLWIALHTRF